MMKWCRLLSILLLILMMVLLSVPVQAYPLQGLDDLLVFDDQLAENWQNWSWGSTVDFNSSAVVYAGSRSIRVIYSPWGGLSLYKADLPLFGKTHLQFYVHGGSGGDKPLRVFVNFEDHSKGPDYAIVAKANQWQKIEIPLAQLNPSNLKITRLNWQNASSNNNLTVYFDEIRFVGSVPADAPRILSGEYRSHSVRVDSPLVVRAWVDDPQGKTNIAQVTLESDGEGWLPLPLYDDGLNNDGESHDGLFGAVINLPTRYTGREIGLYLRAVDRDGNAATRYIGRLNVLSEVVSPIPPSLPQKLGWGSNAWSENPSEDWQKNTGLPWNYVYQYITWGWEGWGGQFVQRFVHHSWQNGFIPVVTVYLMLGATGGDENAAVYAEKLKDATVVSAYLQSLERAVIEARGDKPVIFVIEPDFYGFMQQLSNSDNPPAGVQPNNPDSFPVALNRNGYSNTLSGFGQYLIDLIHNRAPNALAAPMVSIWGVKGDAMRATERDVLSYVQLTAEFMRKMGADRADLIAVEWSDRDAARGIRPWWDDQDTQLPSPNRAIFWAHHLGKALNKRLLLWQVPVGNMNLDDTCNRYRDNRAAYLFRYPRDLWEAGYVGILFGGGDECSTQVWTDGGFVESQARLYYRPPSAPSHLTALSVEGAMVHLRWRESTESDVIGYRVYYQSTGGPSGWVDTGLRSSLWATLPKKGVYHVWVTSYDLNGGESGATNLVILETEENAQHLYLPLIRR